MCVWNTSPFSPLPSASTKKVCVCVNVTKSMRVQPLFTSEGVCFNYRVNVCMKQLSSQLEGRLSSSSLSLTISRASFSSHSLSFSLHPLRRGWMLYRASEHCYSTMLLLFEMIHCLMKEKERSARRRRFLSLTCVSVCEWRKDVNVTKSHQQYEKDWVCDVNFVYSKSASFSTFHIQIERKRLTKRKGRRRTHRKWVTRL